LNDPKSISVVVVFDAILSDDEIGGQELALVGEFLPELLKEMMWHASEQET
jgi:hypothetical protein